MLKTLIVLPDGTEISSGVGAAIAIQSMTLTECVNEAQELTLGSTCSNMVEVKFLAPEGSLQIAAGEELTAYKVDEDSTRTKVGIFITQKPTRPTANSMAVTAYDRVSLLDKDLSWWLHDLQDWPYSLFELAQMVCDECGVSLVNEDIPNGGYMVAAFSGEGITGRQIMRWIGEISGRFCRATADGALEFAWYTPVEGITIGPASADGQIHYYQNGLSFEDYEVAPIQKVQMKQNEEDVGTVYPADIMEEVNAYTITGNYLLTATNAEALVPVAQTLYEQLSAVSYTPCKVSVPTRQELHAGNIVTITDRNGRNITAYVMKKVQSGQRDTLECTGSMSRNSSAAINEKTFSALIGKVLNLRTDVDGIKVENKDMAGNMADIRLSLDGIRTSVQAQNTEVAGVKSQLSTVEQTADGLSASVQSIMDNGVEKVSNKFGLSIDGSAVTIHREGSQMENKLNEEGMYVLRSGETMLQADANGVIATDVTVNNYLSIGHARFEDYANDEDGSRTACFFV